jgi:hypothetical protein
MNRRLHSTRSLSRAGLGWDLLLVFSLFAAGLAIRWWYAGAVTFPAADESAFHLTTAKNVVNGRGLEVDVLWSYQVPFPGVTHPSHERWMPLTTGLIAAAYAAQRAISGSLETPFRTAQMPGLILGALLVPFTYLVGRRALPGDPSSTGTLWQGSRWVSLAAALLVAVNASLSYQSAGGDSSAPFALVAAWALAIAVRKPGDQGGYVGTGLLIALACLTWPGGLVLLLAIPLAWWLLPVPARPPTELPDNPAAELVWKYWPRQKGPQEEWQRTLGPGLRNLLDLGVAFALVVTPWLLRNYMAFGTPLPGSLLSQAWLTDHIDNFNYLSPPTWQTWITQGWQTMLDQRFQALFHNGRVLLLSTLPWGLLAIPGLWLLRREWSFFVPFVYGLLLFFGLALVFPISSVYGAFYHSLGALMPFLALAAMVAVQRAGHLPDRLQKPAAIISTIAVVVLLVCSLVLTSRILPTVAERHQVENTRYETIAGWFAQHTASGAVIMTTRTYPLNYSSDHPTIALPGNEPPDAAWEAAQRYGARYLVITQPFGQYPQILLDQPDPRFRLLEETETALIYEIGREQP